MIKRADISFPDLQEEEYDSSIGTSSGAGAIFGSTGGVLEAAVRTDYCRATGEGGGISPTTENCAVSAG